MWEDTFIHKIGVGEIRFEYIKYNYYWSLIIINTYVCDIDK